MTDRISHNLIIKGYLTTAGFDVRWSLNDSLLVSLNRRVLTSEVRTTLLDAGFEDGMFTTCSDSSHGVIVDAVC